MADRLKIGKEYQDPFVRDGIDEHDILFLKSKGERVDVFMFLLALGVKKGIRTPSKTSLGFVLEATAMGSDASMSYIYSVAISELRKTNQENMIDNKEVVYKIAEEYVNTGFLVLQELVPDFTDFDEDTFVYQLIDMLDDEYDAIVNNVEYMN